MALENAGRCAQSILDSFNLSPEFDGPAVTPERDFGDAGSQGLANLYVNALVGCDQVRSDCKPGGSFRTSTDGRKPGAEIERPGPQNLQPSHIAAVGHQNIDVPAAIPRSNHHPPADCTTSAALEATTLIWYLNRLPVPAGGRAFGLNRRRLSTR